jgi:hypothetical protein
MTTHESKIIGVMLSQVCFLMSRLSWGWISVSLIFSG